ncbi:hypothetical protein [Arthrobacter sp. 2MCAF14]|uniref:hypothetical protein n=1 Tax=Arthrobacter sp. 2MCAF14 TaxID=3232982 RepID=UPI003F925F7C
MDAPQAATSQELALATSRGEVPRAIIKVRNEHAISEEQARAHPGGQVARYKS